MIQLIDPRSVGFRWANATGSDLVGPTIPGNVADIVNGSGTGTAKWWQNSDIWNAIGTSMSGLTDMFGNIFGGAGNKQTDTVSNAGANYIVPNQNQKSNNTWLWIVGVVLLLAVAAILLRKFKK